MTEDARFEALEEDTTPGLGPLALLLAGLGEEAAKAATSLLAEVGASTHRVLRATREMLSQTLATALEEDAQSEPLPPEALPRVIVLSGLTGKQIHGFIDTWRDAGLPTPIWASTTPHNLTFTLKDLLKELLSEARAMAAPPR